MPLRSFRHLTNTMNSLLLKVAIVLPKVLFADSTTLRRALPDSVRVLALWWSRCGTTVIGSMPYNHREP